VVLSTQFDDRPVGPPVEDYLTVTRAEGWSSTT
jgi:Lrp/AsnC family leucine-responsive transcriptional regulator